MNIARLAHLNTETALAFLPAEPVYSQESKAISQNSFPIDFDAFSCLQKSLYCVISRFISLIFWTWVQTVCKCYPQMTTALTPGDKRLVTYHTYTQHGGRRLLQMMMS